MYRFKSNLSKAVINAYFLFTFQFSHILVFILVVNYITRRERETEQKRKFVIDENLASE